MAVELKKFAHYINRDFRTTGGFHEIQDEQQAVVQALEKDCVFFEVIEVETVSLNGKEFKGEPVISDRRYVGVDRLYSRQEMIDSQKEKIRTNTERSLAEAFAGGLSYLQKMPADTLYINDSRCGFHPLKEGEKVFDSTGAQIWPKPQQPTAQAAPKPPRP